MSVKGQGSRRGRKRDGRSKRRRASEAAPAAGSPPTAAPADSSADASDESLDAAPDASAPAPRSGAAVVAVVLFLWGLSLLAFDEARRELFRGDEEGHLLLVAPVFAGAAAAALVAWIARRFGRVPVGGDFAHRFALASGLLGLTALALLLSLGPRLHRAEALTRDARARDQVQRLALVLERYRASVGRYPPVVGIESLAAAVVPEHDPGPLPLIDPWGRPVWYQTIGEGTGYLLVGLGADGRQSLPEASYLEADAPARLGDDVVAVSGRILGGEG